MPPPPLRHERPPLRDERSTSQNNSLGIRVVPYTPPRPDYQQSLVSRNTSRQLSSDWIEDSLLVDDDASRAVQTSSSGGGPRPAPSSPSTPPTPGPSTTARGNFAVSDSDASTQSPFTPDLNTRSYSSPNCNNVNAQTQPSQQDGRTSTSTSAPPSSPRQRLLPRRRIGISLNSDKTFSLIPHQHNQGDRNDRDIRSPRLSYSTITSVASDPFTEEQPPSSPLSTLPEHDRSPLTASPSSKTATPTATRVLSTVVPAGPASPTSSPWNYHLVGGLRKVPQTPNLKKPSAARAASFDSTPSVQADHLASLPAALAPQPSESSLPSIDTPSTASETINYKIHDFTSPYQPSLSEESDEPNFRVIGHSSSPAPYQPSPSEASDELNFRVIGHSPSPAPYEPSHTSSTSDEPNFCVISQSSPSPSAYTREPPTSPGSDDNYIVHGASSPLYYSSPIGAGDQVVREQYSQESLIVSPLQPRYKPPVDRLGHFKSISRESLRRAASLKSISSVLSQEIAHSVLLAAPAAVYLQGGPQSSFFNNIPHEKRTKATLGSSRGTVASPTMSHSHQWRSQLSTVASESEQGSDPASRSLSPTSHQTGRGSGFSRSHSRNMLSISSSADEHSLSHHSRSPSDDEDRSHAALARPSQRDLRQIRDQDEHGDGLTDLYVLHQRPSRTRLAALFSASSDRNLHSSTSSRANSFSSISLPTWAKLYYGSGERRILAVSSESTFSEACETGPASSTRTGSPSGEQFPSHIYNQRRRPREAKQKKNDVVRDISSHSGEVQDYRPRRFLRKQTSSVWSPHLHNDQRASRYSIWEPPSATWTADGPLFGRRNLQVVLFIVGFVFPFAWMIGAFLPLPPDPQLEMAEGDGSRSNLDVSSLPGHSLVPQTTYYEGARWWRQLNRYMSIVGLLVVGAVIALVVIGVRQDWGSHRS